MSQLHFAGLTQDGRTMLVVDNRGEQHHLTVDERVKAAARGDAARLGQLELTIEPSLRPAEIQARVRAGESPEDVARAASMTVDKVLRFAGPVLAERELYADRARAARLRHDSAADGSLLGETVDERLRERGIGPEQTSWDSGRRPDGTWRIVLRWGAGKQAGEAVWVYDPLAKHVTVNDEGARDLLAAAVQRVDEPAEPAARPFSLIRSAVEEAPEAPAHEQREAPAAGAEQEHAATEQEQAVASGEGVRPGRGRRPQVPPWDDIMFGARQKNG